MMKKPHLYVALPDSLVSEVAHLREKTSKIGLVGRACAIFAISRIYIYTDERGRYENDYRVMKILLEYMETPQYLRKRLFMQEKALQYAGLLPPLRTPHHKPEVPLQDVQTGEVREGIAIRAGGRLLADVGLSSLVPLEGVARNGERITVRITSPFPQLRGRVIEKGEAEEYWGYEVKRAPSLGRFVKSTKTDLMIFTSRRGMPVVNIWDDLVSEARKVKSILIVFGSPRRGIFEILSDEGMDPWSLSKFVVNTIPGQATATVRTEEALLSTLALLNLTLHA